MNANFMPVSIETIPEELKNLNQWILWRGEQRGGQWAKIPHSRDGKKASSTDSSTWADFDSVAECYGNGSFDGIGFVFVKDGDLTINEPLMKAYYLKEELHSLWEQENKLVASIVFASWISMAQASGVGMLKRFAATLMRHREGILSYYDHKITSARIEGTNTKIRVMQRKAYGFRDEEYL
jgi:hypothetical protein